MNGLSIRKCRRGLNNHGLPNNPNIQNPLNLLKNPMIESESDYENKKGGYMICDLDFLRGIFQIMQRNF